MAYPRPTVTTLTTGTKHRQQKRSMPLQIYSMQTLLPKLLAAICLPCIENQGLHSAGHSISLSGRPQKTAGRKAFIGVCHAVNVVFPTDIDDRVTNMHDSSLARLARAVRRVVK